MMKSQPILVVLSLAAALSAQSYVVSPKQYDLHEGTSNNTYPFFSTAFRYQQAHSDLKGTPRVFTGLSFRRDGTLSTTASYGARTYDLELHVGDADLATLTGTFATNYLSTPVNVMTRKNVNVPDHTTRPDYLPAKFDADFLFDVPFVYTSGKDLLWEAVVFSNTNSASYPLDAVSSATGLTGGFGVSGTGCTTANGVMKLRSNFATNVTTNQLTMGWAITAGASSSSTVVFLGLTNPNAPLPGLCNSENVYTDALLGLVSGTTGTTGALTIPAIALTYNPAWLALHVTSQAVSLDASQPLGIAVSNGNDAPVPPLASTVPMTRIFASGSSSATTGTVGTSYGLVTRFRH